MQQADLLKPGHSFAVAHSTPNGKVRSKL